MNIDSDKIDQAVLGLLYLSLHSGNRAPNSTRVAIDSGRRFTLLHKRSKMLAVQRVKTGLF